MNVDKSTSQYNQYPNLLDAGFTSEQLDKALNRRGGAKNLKALHELLQPMLCGEEVFIDTHEQPITPLAQLQQAGVSTEQLIKVVDNNGGSKNLDALRSLLQPILFGEGVLSDDHNPPITALVQLQQAGFSIEELIKILSNNGGARNLKAFQNLLQPILFGEGILTDIHNQLITPLSLLLQAGFTTQQLINVLDNNGGSKNLEALCGLLHPILAGEEALIDTNSQPITALAQLQQAGFTAQQLIKVLDNDGGSKNLEALHDLLQPLFFDGSFLADAHNQPITTLTHLQQAGFTVDHLIKVLGHGGGAINLEALRNLLQPMFLDEEILTDSQNQPITALAQLQQAGFSVLQLINVLGHTGGSKNLEALQRLLQPILINGKVFTGAHNQLITALTQLQQAGVTAEQLIKVLGHGGGAINLEALHSLLQPMFFDEKTLTDTQNQPIPALAQLQQAGFSTPQLINVLGHTGGSKNMEALQRLLQPILVNGEVLTDAHNQLITPLTQLHKAGFTAQQLIKILNNDGGAKNLEALHGLLQPILVGAEVLTDIHNQLIIPLTQLQQIGFTAEQLIKILEHNGGSKNLEALRGLLQPMLIGEEILTDDHNQIITPLIQLQQAHFSIEQLIKILAHDGGSKNLEALHNLLRPMHFNEKIVTDANNQPATALDQLQQAGFTNEQLIKVLDNDGGAKNLEALRGLLQSMNYSQETIHNQPITALAQLQQAGFTAQQLIKVLEHDGGSKNLEALYSLLQPILIGEEVLTDANNRLIIPLIQLQQAGFTSEQLIKILDNNGGSKNLEALCSLLHPILLNEEVINDANNQTSTALVQLQQAGFTNEQLIQVLNHGGGSKNLEALQKLTLNQHPLLSSYPNACNIIIGVASGKSKSTHLDWLNSLLNNSYFSSQVHEHRLLSALCRKIKPMNAKSLEHIIIDSIKTLHDFISVSSNKRLREKVLKEQTAKRQRLNHTSDAMTTQPIISPPGSEHLKHYSIFNPERIKDQTMHRCSSTISTPI